jgi:anaerobic C4-dicarboxylate transporter
MRRVAAWLAWWGGLFVLWLLLVGTVAGTEVIAGVVAAAIGASATEVVRSVGLLDFRVEWRWLRRTPRQLSLIVPDFFRVLATVFGPRRGVFRTLPFPTGGDGAVDHGRRAWVGFAASLAPNRLVVDVDPERGEVLVHDLIPDAADEEILR